MGLDLVHVAEQMPALLERIGEERRRGHERLRHARSALTASAAAPNDWRVRIEEAQTRWPLALPLGERANAGYAAPALPDAYAITGADGSHIDVDRNAAAPCYVLNLGWAAIRYGADAGAELASHSELQPSTTGLVERDDEDASREDSIRGEVLNLLRAVHELALLAELASELPAGLPGVALLDGNLGLWTVAQAAISSRLRERFIRGQGGLLPSLNALRAQSRNRRLAFGAYTSAPATSDVIHALRVAVCPMETVTCTRCPGLSSPERPCDEVGLATDAVLFGASLEPGERSALFQARSRSFTRPGEPRSEPWYEAEGHAVAFFYLRLDHEVARVELPLWAADQDRVGLLHAALLDQCDKGPGYPVVLQEAHEQAVITTVDRASFAALLERELELAGGALGGSAKARSKRTRRI